MYSFPTLQNNPATVGIQTQWSWLFCTLSMSALMLFMWVPNWIPHVVSSKPYITSRKCAYAS